MALLKIWQVSRAIMRLLVIQFVCWLGWFSTFALAQFEISEGVTGSLNNFPTLGITCVGNLAVFVTSVIRGRLDLEMGARDVLDILLTPKLEKIQRIKHGYGLTTCTQRNAANEGGGDLPTASAEQVPQTASREESDVHAASTRGTETASTEGNVNTSASTERGGLQTASTAHIVIHMDSPEGQAAVAAIVAAKKAEKAAKAAAAKAETTEAAKVKAAKTAEAAEEAAKEAAEAAEEAKEAAEAAGAVEAREAAEASILFARKKGLKSAAVIMLSNDTANWSMKQFMKSNAYVVQSIVLPFLPLKRALNDTKDSEELTSGVTIKSCECRHHRCHCIVFWTMEEITHMLATRMPATLKLLSNSLCLLPCSTCLRKGCHECNQENLLRAESEADEGQPMRQRVVSDILHKIRARDIPAGKPIGICIPMNDAHGDDWTKLLLKSLRSKDAEGRGITNKATEALEGYLGGGRGSEEGSVEYDIFSSVVPRLTEILINLVLTFWFRVDAFSSALLARRTVRDYLVDTKSSGFAANAFLTEAVVKSNGDNSQVCQVLTFRGRDWLCFITFISVGCVNVICALGWSLLISFEGGPDTSQPPSLPRVAVIIAAIGSPWLVFIPIGSRWLRFMVGMVAAGSSNTTVQSTLDETDNTVQSTLDETDNTVQSTLDETDNTVQSTLDETDNTVQSFVGWFLHTADRTTVWWFVLVFVVVFGVVFGVIVWIVLIVIYLVLAVLVGMILVLVVLVEMIVVLVVMIVGLVVFSPVIWPGCLLAALLKQRRKLPYASPLIATGLLFEMACFVSWSALAGAALGIKGFGRWLYAALQILIWVKWATGSYFLNRENSLEFFGKMPHRELLIVYSSTFWLNAVLAGVRCKWEAWPWKHNHLF